MLSHPNSLTLMEGRRGRRQDEEFSGKREVIGFRNK